MIVRRAGFIAAAALGTAAAAQVPPAPPPGGGGRPTELPTGNRGMGAVTDIPNQHSDPRTAAEDALARRGDVQSSLVRSGQTKEQRQAVAYRAAIDRYVAQSDRSRLEALAAAQSPVADDADARAIRSTLEKDLAGWGKAFGFDRAAMADQRAQWLAEATPLTAADWTRRRADWFAARDAWIAQQRTWADEKAAAPD